MLRGVSPLPFRWRVQLSTLRISLPALDPRDGSLLSPICPHFLPPAPDITEVNLPDSRLAAAVQLFELQILGVVLLLILLFRFQVKVRNTPVEGPLLSSDCPAFSVTPPRSSTCRIAGPGS